MEPLMLSSSKDRATPNRYPSGTLGYRETGPGPFPGTCLPADEVYRQIPIVCHTPPWLMGGGQENSQTGASVPCAFWGAISCLLHPQPSLHRPWGREPRLNFQEGSKAHFPPPGRPSALLRMCDPLLVPQASWDPIWQDTDPTAPSCPSSGSSHTMGPSEPLGKGPGGPGSWPGGWALFLISSVQPWEEP